MPKHVLVADDSLTIRKVIGMVFATEDFQLTTVDNGVDAIQRARELKPDAVLADVMMPGKSGYEVCEALKQDPSTQSIPVLLLAGTFEPFDENRARAARADDHIVKPFESQALLEKVRTLTGAGPSTAKPAQPAAAAPTGAPRPTSPGMPMPAGPAGTRPLPVTSPGGPPLNLRSGAPGMPPPAGAPPGGGMRPAPVTNPGMPRPGMPGAPGMPMAGQPGMRPAPMTNPGMPMPGQPAPGMRPAPMTNPGMPMPGQPGPGMRPGPGMAPQQLRPGMPMPPQGAPMGRQGPPGPAPGGFARPPPGAPMPGMAPGPGQAPRGRDPFGLGGAPAPAPVNNGGAELALDAGAPPPAARPKANDGGEAQLREALSKASREVIEKIAWEVVPQLAETIIREELERLIKERESRS